jgi:hypothetical protein
VFLQQLKMECEGKNRVWLCFKNVNRYLIVVLNVIWVLLFVLIDNKWIQCGKYFTYLVRILMCYNIYNIIIIIINNVRRRLTWYVIYIYILILYVWKLKKTYIYTIYILII